MTGRRRLLGLRCGSGDRWRMARGWAHVRRRMAAILFGGIACLTRSSCHRRLRSRIRSRFRAVNGGNGGNGGNGRSRRNRGHRRGDHSTGNRSFPSGGRRRWSRDLTGPRPVLSWRRASDDPERLIIVEPIVIRDDTHDRDRQYAGRRNPKRNPSAPRKRRGLDVCLRASCAQMRKLGRPEH